MSPTKAEFLKTIEHVQDPVKRIERMLDHSWEIRRSYPQFSLELSIDARELSLNSGNTSLLGFCYRNSGTAFYLLSLYESALNDLNISLNYFMESGNINEEATVLRNIGNIYHSVDEDDKALDCYHQAVQLTIQCNDEQGTAYNYGNIGYVLLKKENYPEALIYMNKTVEICERISDDLGKADALNNIGRTNVKIGNLVDAERSLKLSLDLSHKINHLRGIAWSNNNLGKLFLELNDLNLALKHQELALDAARQMGEKLLVYEILESISNIYEHLGDLKLSLEFYKNFEKTKSEVLKADSKSTLNSVKFKFDLEQSEKEKEIFRLKNIELVKAEEIIREKNKDITDSIHYAQRIQAGVLTSEHTFKKLFSDSFLFFKPKDIVSGDFFWCSEAGDQLMVGCIDCTGHGVPGAFMSIIGHAILNSLVKEKLITRPDLLLTGLHKELRNHFGKDEGGISLKDGMDITICSINRITGEVHFSGAYNPLVIIEGNDIIMIKSDKIMMGTAGPENPVFKLNELGPCKEKRFYMFSDGFADQFGGEKGKKFKIKNFQDLLYSTRGFSLEEQGKLIEQNFINWKEGFEQVDDVLVIGFKI